MTFSLRPRSGSLFSESAASVRTRVVSWNDAADNQDFYSNYIDEVKPYRTKIREYVSSYNTIDNTQTMITDFDIPSVGRGNTSQPLPVKIVDGEILFVDSEITQYPWKNWLDNTGFKVTTIEIVDGGSGYISKPVVDHQAFVEQILAIIDQKPV